VALDGLSLDEADLRLLCAQRALAHHPAEVVSLGCRDCGAPLTSRPGQCFFQPSTQHHCDRCGSISGSTRRVFSHPLAARWPWSVS